MPLPSAFGAWLCLGLASLACAARAAPLPPATAPAATLPPAAASALLAAVWKEQRVNFFYMGRTARYSCDGLRDKVRAILLDLGARRDLKVTAIGCEGYGHARAKPMSPTLSITFAALATPDPSVKPHAAVQVADARFEAFTIASDAFRNIDIGDCELVEELARQILPKFATRALKRDIACGPDRLSGSRFLVMGEILKPQPRPAQAGGKTPKAP